MEGLDDLFLQGKMFPGPAFTLKGQDFHLKHKKYGDFTLKNVHNKKICRRCVGGETSNFS